VTVTLVFPCGIAVPITGGPGGAPARGTEGGVSDRSAWSNARSSASGSARDQTNDIEILPRNGSLPLYERPISNGPGPSTFRVSPAHASRMGLPLKRRLFVTPA
jgi:hypothetical protein